MTPERSEKDVPTKLWTIQETPGTHFQTNFLHLTMMMTGHNIEVLKERPSEVTYLFYSSLSLHRSLNN